MKRYRSVILASGLLAVALTACNGGQKSGNPMNNDTAAAGNSVPASSGEIAPTPGSKTTLVFSTFWQDPKYKAAVKAYEAKHPDIEIKLESAYTSEATLESDLEKYVSTLNTAMLAGKGPDLMETDLLPTDSYVNHGLLADLTPLMQEDKSFKKSDYFTNVLDNARDGNSLYAMPLSFFLMGLAGDEGAIAKTGVKFDDRTWSWNDFTAAAEKMVASGGLPSALSYEGPEYLLGEMVSDNYSLFVDPDKGEASFDSASFTGLMKQVKALFDDGLVSKIGRGVNAYFRSVQINSPKNYLESMQEYGLSVKMFDPDGGDHMKLYAKPHAQDIAAGGYFKTYRSVAVSARSKAKQEAWDFVKFMLEDEADQTAATTTGFPMNRKAYEKQLAELKKQGSFPSAEEGPLHGSMIQVDEAMLNGLDAYVNGAVHRTQDDDSDKLKALIVEESRAFFAGQKSAEAVANLIQNKAMTYLNE